MESLQDKFSSLSLIDLIDVDPSTHMVRLQSSNIHQLKYQWLVALSNEIVNKIESVIIPNFWKEPSHTYVLFKEVIPLKDIRVYFNQETTVQEISEADFATLYYENAEEQIIFFSDYSKWVEAMAARLNHEKNEYEWPKKCNY